MGKARVAPLKHTTIPHLELTAATMAGRMDKMLRKELQLQLAESVFWTDSTAVLKYINNETTRFRTFVANRVSQILKVSVASQWRHINSHLNPADCVSRGQNVGLFLQNHVWISGPDFLTAPNNSWPKTLDHLEALNPADPEIKKNVSISTFALNKGPDVLQQLIEHYSSWIRLKKAVAWILKVKNILLVRAKERLEQTADTARDISKARQSQTLTNIRLSHRKENLTVEDLKEAELEIISHCQGQNFEEEVTALLKATYTSSIRFFRMGS